MLQDEIRFISTDENVSVDFILHGLKTGEIVIPKNKNKKISRLCGIGKGLRTKINANIGTSEKLSDIDLELKKLKVAIKSGADTVMDLSTGKDLRKVRQKIIKHSTVPVGTVPIYEAAIASEEKYGSIFRMKEDEIFSVIERHLEDGVDFITVHCGVTQSAIGHLKKQGRVCGIVSRGGAILYCWMVKNDKENPLFSQYDRLLEIAKKYDVVLSLGDGLRPGSLSDATDRAQIQELLTLGELVDRARREGVQVMVEGPGHIPLDEIETNVKLQKYICKNAPFYVLGPLPCDTGVGYDHIVGAIGGAVAGMFGADYLCYVTPSEHIGLPTVDDVREGVIITKIAAHIADIAKGIPSAKERNFKMSHARFSLDWRKQKEYALDKSKIRDDMLKIKDTCTMCGKYCSLKLQKEAITTPNRTEEKS